MLGRVREKLGGGEREEPWIFDEKDRESENPNVYLIALLSVF